MFQFHHTRTMWSASPVICFLDRSIDTIHLFVVLLLVRLHDFNFFYKKMEKKNQGQKNHTQVSTRPCTEYADIRRNL